QNGSAGGGNVTITVTDSGSGGCTANAPVTDPGSCSSAGGDCTPAVYASTDVNKDLLDAQSTTSILQIPTGGTIQDVNVLNLSGTHTWVSVLIFRLKSPAGTE